MIKHQLLNAVISSYTSGGMVVDAPTSILFEKVDGALHEVGIRYLNRNFTISIHPSSITLDSYPTESSRASVRMLRDAQNMADQYPLTYINSGEELTEWYASTIDSDGPTLAVVQVSEDLQTGMDSISNFIRSLSHSQNLDEQVYVVPLLTDLLCVHTFYKSQTNLQFVHVVSDDGQDVYGD